MPSFIARVANINLSRGKDPQYPVSTEVNITLPMHVVEVVKTLCEAGKKIRAIKYIRAEYGLGLKNSKDVVDFLDDVELNLMIR